MLYVLRNDGAADTYVTGTKWHIDEEEMLHVLDASKAGLGSYARGSWSSIHTTLDDSWAQYDSRAALAPTYEVRTNGKFGVSTTTYSSKE